MTTRQLEWLRFLYHEIKKTGHPPSQTILSGYSIRRLFEDKYLYTYLRSNIWLTAKGQAAAKRQTLERVG